MDDIMEEINVLFACNKKKCFIFRGREIPKAWKFAVICWEGGRDKILCEELGGSKASEVFAVLWEGVKLHPQSLAVPKSAAGHSSPPHKPGQEV